jgi:hypothetical protein
MDVLIRLSSALLPRNNHVDKVLDGRKRETILTIYRLLKLTITNLKKQFATKHLN